MTDVCVIVPMAAAKSVLLSITAGRHFLTTGGYKKFSFYACQPRGSQVMRSIISTSIANVIRLSVEATEMLRNDVLASLRLHLKSCGSSLSSLCSFVGKSRWQTATANPGTYRTNPWVQPSVKFARSAGLIPAIAYGGTERGFGNGANLADGRGIDANDHQRLTSFSSQRHG